MEQTILMVTHNMDIQIEDEPLPWYLVNTVIDQETVEVLKYKDIMESK